MRLNKVNIQNFRCFKNYEVLLAKKTTVLLGKNGTGKTSLIAAIKKGLSFLFASSPNYTHSLNTANNCNVRSFTLWDARFDEIERNFSLPIKNDFFATYNNKEIEWTFLKKKDPGSLHPTLYKNALESILTDYNADAENISLPLIAYFSDSYPHILSNVGEKASRIARMDVLPRDFGYYGWDEDTNCAELWQRRFIKIVNYVTDFENELNRLEKDIAVFETPTNSESNENLSIKAVLRERFQKLKNNADLCLKYRIEISFIEYKIFTFTAPLREELNFINQEFQINRIYVNRPDRKSSSIEFSFVDNKTMHFDILPAGYRRLLSIVFDIAYRSYILNEGKLTEGVVMIDEIELHLHPTLQQDVLERFQKTFPGIQFIISTHSPLVASNLKADGVENKILNLENNGMNYSNHLVENVYGIDYATNLSEIMEVAPRPSTIDKYINGYVFLMNKDKEDEAKKMLEKLKEYLGGEIPNLLQKEIDNQIKSK